MNYYPFFRVGSWNNGVRCMSFCISMLLTVLIFQCQLAKEVSCFEHIVGVTEWLHFQTFSNLFCCIKIIVFWLKIHCNFCPRIQLTISTLWSKQWQAIIWTTYGLSCECIFASLSLHRVTNKRLNFASLTLNLLHELQFSQTKGWRHGKFSQGTRYLWKAVGNHFYHPTMDNACRVASFTAPIVSSVIIILDMFRWLT